MKFWTGFTKLASIPAHHKVVTFKGASGYWVTNQLGHKLFISAKSGRVWFPIVFRGRKPDEVMPSEFDALTPEQSGEASYQEWLAEFKNQKALDDIHNGYEFTDNGKKYLDRLKKMLLKHKLDQHGLDFQTFDKMTSTNDIDKVKQLAKSLGKKYRVISQTLKQDENPDVERMDKEFLHNWSKLMPLFDFDPNNYNPKIDTPEDIHTKEVEKTFTTFLAKVRPILDVQMNDVDDILTILAKSVKDRNLPIAQKSWNVLTDILVNNVKKHYFHIVGKHSAYILELPEYHQMHEVLFHEN